ncbi:hypothetical protein Tco_0885502 [Tanacetum coccineum]
MTNSSFSFTFDNEDLSDINLLLEAVEYDQLGEAGRPRTRNWINRERDIAEEHLSSETPTELGQTLTQPLFPDLPVPGHGYASRDIFGSCFTYDSCPQCGFPPCHFSKKRGSYLPQGVHGLEPDFFTSNCKRRLNIVDCLLSFAEMMTLKPKTRHKALSLCVKLAVSFPSRRVIHLHHQDTSLVPMMADIAHSDVWFASLSDIHTYDIHGG